MCVQYAYPNVTTRMNAEKKLLKSGISLGMLLLTLITSESLKTRKGFKHKDIFYTCHSQRIHLLWVITYIYDNIEKTSNLTTS